MFGAFNLLIIWIFVATATWSIRDSMRSSIVKSKFGNNSDFFFNFAAGLLAAWFAIVGAVYCLHDLIVNVYSLFRYLL